MRIHLIDIENLSGVTVPSEAEVSRALKSYETRTELRPGDEIVIASAHKTSATVRAVLARTGYARYTQLEQSGQDGADLALISWMIPRVEKLRNDVRHDLFLGSGDGIFHRLLTWIYHERPSTEIRVIAKSQWECSNDLKTSFRVAYLDSLDSSTPGLKRRDSGLARLYREQFTGEVQSESNLQNSGTAQPITLQSSLQIKPAQGSSSTVGVLTAIHLNTIDVHGVKRVRLAVCEGSIHPAARMAKIVLPIGDPLWEKLKQAAPGEEVRWQGKSGEVIGVVTFKETTFV